ncbi:MAG: hypothetical protein ACPLZH_02480, partial [Minisyncoccales bacterium]
MSEEEIYYLYTKKEKKEEKKEEKKRIFLPVIFFLLLSLFFFLLIEKGIIKRRPWEEKPEKLTSRIIDSMKKLKSFEKRTSGFLRMPSLEIFFEANGKEGFSEETKSDVSFNFYIDIKDASSSFYGRYDFAGQVKAMGNDLFVNFSKIPEKDFFGNSLSSLKNVWIKINPRLVVELKKELIGDHFLLEPEDFLSQILESGAHLVGMKGFPSYREGDIFALKFFRLEDNITTKEEKKQNLSHYRIVLNKEEIGKSVSQMFLAASTLKQSKVFSEQSAQTKMGEF